METKTKSNGVAKRQTATIKKEVQDKLTNETIGKTVVPEKKVTAEKPVINLDWGDYINFTTLTNWDR